jgi:hypothetical protein
MHGELQQVGPQVPGTASLHGFNLRQPCDDRVEPVDRRLDETCRVLGSAMVIQGLREKRATARADREDHNRGNNRRWPRRRPVRLRARRAGQAPPPTPPTHPANCRSPRSVEHASGEPHAGWQRRRRLRAPASAAVPAGPDYRPPGNPADQPCRSATRRIPNRQGDASIGDSAARSGRSRAARQQPPLERSWLEDTARLARGAAASHLCRMKRLRRRSACQPIADHYRTTQTTTLRYRFIVEDRRKVSINACSHSYCSFRHRRDRDRRRMLRQGTVRQVAYVDLRTDAAEHRYPTKSKCRTL